MTRTIGSNSVGSEFLYDANRSRTVQLEYNQADGTGAPTHYVRKRVYGLGPTLEVNYNNEASGTPTWTMKKVRIYVPGPDGVIGAREFDNPTTSGGTETALVYHYDHLGSIDSITPFASTSGTYANDAAGKPARFSEDAWGQRRNPSNWSGAPTTTDDGGSDSVTPRGFTGHEMLDDLGLVHMNGRIYDPLIGRMLSADLLVKNPGDLQCYNRYSYVRNNPLTLIDPSGFDDDAPANTTGFWEAVKAYVSVLIPDPFRSPSLTPSSEGDTGVQQDIENGVRAADAQFTRGLEGAAKTTDTLSNLVPGVAVGKDFAQIVTGKDVTGLRDANRSDGVKSLATQAVLGTALEKGAKPLSEAASKVAGALGKAISKEGSSVARADEGAITSGLKSEVAKTSREARREAMREEGIPTSQQPVSQSKNSSGREYSYEVPKEGGGTQIKSVQQQTMDKSHPGEKHWEAGTVKTDPRTGEVRQTKHGRPKIGNDKTKVNYED